MHLSKTSLNYLGNNCEQSNNRLSNVPITGIKHNLSYQKEFPRFRMIQRFFFNVEDLNNTLYIVLFQINPWDIETVDKNVTSKADFFSYNHLLISNMKINDMQIHEDHNRCVSKCIYAGQSSAFTKFTTLTTAWQEPTHDISPPCNDWHACLPHLSRHVYQKLDFWGDFLKPAR